MEKTKFELDCEQCCAQCMRDSLDICNLPGHCHDEVEMARCGICGKVYCSEEALTEVNTCASCGSIISRNIDANNEILDKMELTYKSKPKAFISFINPAKEEKANILKRMLHAKVITFPDKTFFDVKDIAIGVAAILFFILIQN